MLLEILPFFSMLHNDFKNPSGWTLQSNCSLFSNIPKIILLTDQQKQPSLRQCGSHFTSMTDNLNWDLKLKTIAKSPYITLVYVAPLLKSAHGGSKVIHGQFLKMSLQSLNHSMQNVTCHFFSFVCNQLKFRLKKFKLCFSWFHFIFSPENFLKTLNVTFPSPCNVLSGWSYNWCWLSSWLWLIVLCSVELTAFGHLL